MVPLLSPALEREERAGSSITNECDLVLAIRASQHAGDMARVHELCGHLLTAAWPMFVRRASGLRHNRVLYEEALANMCEHLLHEALDTREQFITQNFPHYLRCMAQEEFTRLLRHEGLRTWDGVLRGGSHRPLHIPRALTVPVQEVLAREASMPDRPSCLTDPHDPYAAFHAGSEAARILNLLGDPTDRRIVYLRVLEGMRWGDVARRCRLSERTARTRFARALAFLRACIERERQAEER